MEKAKGKDVTVEVYVKKDGRWYRFKPFDIHVSPDKIDPYMSYRLISPSYVSYEELTLNQRCLENFDEEAFVDNMLCSTESGGQCVNCHSYQQWNPDRMQFHARQTHGGTLIAYDGKIEKVDMRHDSLLSAGVYPAWHPTEKLIAYSTNMTMQAFHTAAPEKIEVLDSESDLILYDVDKHEVKTIEQQPNELEIFPTWSPDGKWLYFCSAHFVYQSDSVDRSEITMRANEVKYNIYRKSFDLKTRQFGEREMVFCADTLGKSATFPRLSPDGRWLLFTLGEWGCFHIWHHDADLWMKDLKTGEVRAMDEMNSDDTESYHSWSSNGRWVVFSSRRYDGVFTRPFIAHIDAQGRGSKPFELPAKDPDLHRQFLKSYNVPELMKGPVKLSPQEVASKLKDDGKPITYKSK
jgi:dipeptidyl aminopeptidase/acylaminoacyl peptidase